jgi:hypothetical protein
MSARRSGRVGGCLTACPQERCVVLDRQKGCEFYDTQGGDDAEY